MTTCSDVTFYFVFQVMSDSDCTPMDLLKNRHIMRPKQMVYESDVRNLIERVEGYICFYLSMNVCKSAQNCVCMMKTLYSVQAEGANAGSGKAFEDCEQSFVGRNENFIRRRGS